MSDASKDAAALDKLYGACGRIFWLWSNSGLHKSWPVALQSRFVLPAVMTGQYAILEREGVPRAYCSWAWVTLEVETRFVIDPNSLRPEDWTGGDRLWFVDWVAPFNARDTRDLRGRMADRFPRDLARSIRVKPGQKNARIATYAGSDLTRQEASALRASLYQDLFESLRQHPEEGRGFGLMQEHQKEPAAPD
ncbi:toxin-activating lysine-acyltransferase [Loktanella agnita]|uniref:toxin-activating lysine-acyltransferase n=1 Tax=Loktanella agnita TaxID=287097 RepID=UPI0039898412